MKNRIQNLKVLLKEKKLDAVLISSVANITYLTGYSGFSKDEREAFLLITKKNQHIITDGRYSEAVAIYIPHFNLIELTTKKPLKPILRELFKQEKIKRLGIEEDNITIAENKILSQCVNILQHISLSALRSIKDQHEITMIEQACKLGDKAFKHVLPFLKTGISEKGIAFEIELFIKKNGGELSFPPIVAYGKNASIPHHQSGKAKLKKGDFVLLDFGVKLNNYCSDMTRTLIFGKASAGQKRMYQTVLDAQKKSIDFLHTAYSIQNTLIKASEVDQSAREYIVSKNYPSIPHSLGHGIGIEVHETPSLSPKSKDILKPGMVFSVEPGIYIPEFGGVRIEDLVVLEKNCPKFLTKSPRELIEI